MAEWQTIEKAYARALAAAWMDPDQMRRLKLDPRDVLEAQGIRLPDNTSVLISGDLEEIRWEPGNPHTLMLPLPPRPKASIESIDPLDVLLCVSPCCSCCCG